MISHLIHITSRKVNKLEILFIYLTAFIFMNAERCCSQIKTSTNFYTAKGKLLADSSFRISKSQLLTWTLVEDIAIKRISKTLAYPIGLLETQASVKFIFSFKVDKNGDPININLEKYGDFNAPMKPLSFPFSDADTSIKKQIQQLVGLFKPLYDPRKPDTRYHLPYKFETFELKQGQELVKPSFNISQGWITFIHPRAYYEKPYQQMYAPKGVTCTVQPRPTEH